ncbi:hypothetical protein [Streptomyces sp. NPDC058667]|uniref:hypothetical protein n=1 Tax=Streptomyces sp. NPDC058667 TaxID=3346588 RepID=UPI003659207B
MASSIVTSGVRSSEDFVSPERTAPGQRGQGEPSQQENVLADPDQKDQHALASRLKRGHGHSTQGGCHRQ